MTSIACTIIFGSIIAQGIRDTSGVKSMVNFFINVFHGKCLELATALSAFIMSIPVFGDITQVLLSPVAALLAKRKKISMSVMGGYTLLCSSLTHSIVPPTPGILAVAVLLEADLGFVILCRGKKPGDRNGPAAPPDGGGGSGRADGLHAGGTGQQRGGDPRL